jgi:hypothetical protein
MEYHSRKLFRSSTRELRHSTTNPGDDSRFLEYKNLELSDDTCNLTYLQEYDLEETCVGLNYSMNKPIYANDFNFALLIIFINYFLNK